MGNVNRQRCGKGVQAYTHEFTRGTELLRLSYSIVNLQVPAWDLWCCGVALIMIRH